MPSHLIVYVCGCMGGCVCVYVCMKNYGKILDGINNTESGDIIIMKEGEKQLRNGN